MKTENRNTRENQTLPFELDNSGVIFSYGSLLEHEKLRELFKDRGKFEIYETGKLDKAAKLVKANPGDIVILKNVRIENVRVRIVTETILRRWFTNRGGNVRKLVDAGIISAEIPRALFLLARNAEKHEKPRFLNGGLICNLSDDELKMLDAYEWKPVLQRTRITEIKIGGQRFSTKTITFYAAAEPTDQITPEEKAERAELLSANRKPGCLSPQARWHRAVRRA